MAKPKPTGIDLDLYSDSYLAVGEYEYFFNREFESDFIAAAVEAGDIEPATAILFDIQRTVEAIHGGEVTIDEISHLVKQRSGEGMSVTVPYQYMELIAVLFKKYLTSDEGVSLGEAFGIEGGRQGKKKNKDALGHVRRDMSLCRSVLLARVNAERRGGPISLETAYFEVHEKSVERGTPFGVEVIRKAYKKYGRFATKIEASLIGGGTSWSPAPDRASLFIYFDVVPSMRRRHETQPAKRVRGKSRRCEGSSRGRAPLRRCS